MSTNDLSSLGLDGFGRAPSVAAGAAGPAGPELVLAVDVDLDEEPGDAEPAAVTNLVFDMGNVLMRFDGEYFARAFTDTEEDAQLLHRALFGRMEWSLLDAGVISHETMRRLAAARLPERLLPNLDACIQGWPALSEPLEPVNDLAIRMKDEGMGVYLLSNASTRIGEQLENMPAFPIMDGWVVSAFERIMKPDPEIYLVLCDRYGLDPASCLFIDDNPDNCEGARVAGMRPYLFDGDVKALEAAIEEARAGGGEGEDAGGDEGDAAGPAGPIPDDGPAPDGAGVLG